jgi:hypothetical protein
MRISECALVKSRKSKPNKKHERLNSRSKQHLMNVPGMLAYIGCTVTYLRYKLIHYGSQ